jgi:glycosyltransferase involved in cell wall biosynthesis
MKIAIVCTYLSRQEQLDRTLLSFLQYNPKDFVVIVVDDGSPEDIVLPELPFKVDILKLKDKTWHNPCIPFNCGFHKALEYKPNVVIIQNSECMHNGDILSEVKKVTDANYLSFGCYSLARGETPEIIKQDVGSTSYGDSSWYNHSVYRPVAYHFCSAIIKLNGFDERFYNGIAYDDDMFLRQIRNLGLRIDFIDDPYVFHQWHERMYEINVDLISRNQGLFNSLEHETEYKGVHVITPDLQ